MSHSFRVPAARAAAVLVVAGLAVAACSPTPGASPTAAGPSAPASTAPSGSSAASPTTAGSVYDTPLAGVCPAPEAARGRTGSRIR